MPQTLRLKNALKIWAWRIVLLLFTVTLFVQPNSQEAAQIKDTSVNFALDHSQSKLTTSKPYNFTLFYELILAENENEEEENETVTKGNFERISTHNVFSYSLIYGIKNRSNLICKVYGFYQSDTSPPTILRVS